MKFLQLLIVTALLLLQTASAQKPVEISERQQNEKNKTIFAKIAGNQQLENSTANESALIRQLTQHTDNIVYTFQRSYADNTGFTHHVYQARYKGIEVVGMDYVIHSKNGMIVMANGDFDDLDNLLTTPRISEKEISGYANPYKTTDKNVSFIRKVQSLVICRDLLQKTNTFRLAYKVLLTAEVQSESQYIYADAATGETIQYEPLVCTTNAPGTAQTRYSGTQSFTTDLTAGGQYRLREVRNGVNIITLNNNNSTNETGAAATELTDNDNNWTSAETGTNQPATDVHWGTEKVLDYWLTVHSRNSINNAGMDVIGYARYGTGVDADNAYWNPVTQRMYYGAGSTSFRPVTSLDVCAHELGHGVCQFTSNLSYTYASESSALNEGFSDIWGASVEAWAAPGKQRWLIGEEVTLLTPGYLRSMNNPNSGAIKPSPDTYGGTYWNNDPDAHFRSGVLNKWYYILAQGESGTNDLGNTYNVKGLGMNDAARIAYLTEQLLNSTANYAMARTMSIQAAVQLFGKCSLAEVSVTNAWYAVGVGAQFVQNYTINGNTIICNSAVYNIPGLPGGASVIWSIPASAGSVLQLAPNTPAPNQLTITNQKWYGINTFLSANVVGYGCALKNIVNDNSTSASVPYSYYQEACYFYNVYHSSQSGTINSNSSPVFVHQGCMVYVALGDMTGRTVSVSGPAQPMFWTVTGSTSYFPNSSSTLMFQLPLGSGGVPFTFQITGNGACYTRTLLFFSYSNNGRYTYATVPNPVKDLLTVTVKENEEYLVSNKLTSEKDKLQFTMNIYDVNTSRLQLRHRSAVGSMQHQLNTSRLNPGYYILEITDGEQKQSIKFLKE